MARGNLGQSSAGKIYLFVYNIIQFLGWSYGMVRFLTHLTDNNGNYKLSWNHVATSVTFFQTLQAIEVLHCIIGLVPSNAVQTAGQIFSRLVVVWGILRPVSESRDSLGVPLLLFAWSLAELTRYIYYALNIYNIIPKFVVWCRYTFFIALYPIGVTGELLTIISSLPFIRKRLLFSLPLPNILNVSVYYDLILIGIMLSYIPFFPQLYLYMLKQRKKFLGGSDSESSSGATKKAH
jgi:very-long-chain (3R)-3-hydroxyacyl-CoA dehydratase